MSMLFDRRGVMVLLARPTAISLSHRSRWVPEVEEDKALVVGDASCSKEGGVLGFLYGGTDYRDGVRVT